MIGSTPGVNAVHTVAAFLGRELAQCVERSPNSGSSCYLKLQTTASSREEKQVEPVQLRPFPWPKTLRVCWEVNRLRLPYTEITMQTTFRQWRRLSTPGRNAKACDQMSQIKASGSDEEETTLD